MGCGELTGVAPEDAEWPRESGDARLRRRGVDLRGGDPGENEGTSEWSEMVKGNQRVLREGRIGEGVLRGEAAAKMVAAAGVEEEEARAAPR